MARKKRWETTPAQDGVKNFDLFSWKYFHDFIYAEMLDFRYYIWRGHRCDNWLLKPTLDRLLDRLSKGADSEAREEHLSAFKYAARGRRGPNPPLLSTENEWWALGQHHGLATPLLDWTASPFAAAYFAFVGSGSPQTSRRAIYALQPFVIEETSTELVMQHVGPERPPIIEFIRPLADDNPRLVSQGGLFSRAPDGVDIETWVRQHYAGDRRYVLLKVTIPNNDREGCLKSLNRMNINHLSLFPDLYGAAKHCNTTLEVDGY